MNLLLNSFRKEIILNTNYMDLLIKLSKLTDEEIQSLSNEYYLIGDIAIASKINEAFELIKIYNLREASNIKKLKNNKI